MTIYEWEASAQGHGRPQARTIRGEFEDEPGIPVKYLKLKAEMLAIDAAVKNDLDPDTVEVADVAIYVTAEKRGWRR